MPVISYDYGHMQGGQDVSANGYVYEYAEIRKYGPICVNALMRAGHTLINCTPPDGPMTLQQSLQYRTDKANASGSILHLCFHVNAYQTTDNPMGAEVEVVSDAGAEYGQSILNEIIKLGFINRGINRPDLWVTKNTNMPAVLIEPFFCDSKADCNIYDPNELGLAIAQGVVNILGGNIQSSQNQTQQEEKKVKNLVVVGNAVDKRAAEYLADKLQCPIIDASLPFDYSVVEAGGAIGVGGTPTTNGVVGWSSYVKTIITGTDRFDTCQKVLDYIKTV